MTSTTECAWSQVKIKMLGRTFVGIKGFEFTKTREAEYLYGAGDDPIDIQRGQKGYPGNIKLYKYEVDMLNDAALAAGFADITEVPHEALVMTAVFKKRLTDPIRTVTISGIAITELKVGMEGNGKSTEQTLPFMAMKIVFS